LKWPGALSLINIGNHEVSLNLVPVDFVVDAMAALALMSARSGRRCNCRSFAVTTNQLFNAIAGAINGGHSRLTAPRSWVYFFLMLPPSPKITGLPHPAVPYFFVKQLYDSTQAQDLLARTGSPAAVRKVRE
jgi:hypothetical protein